MRRPPHPVPPPSIASDRRPSRFAAIGQRSRFAAPPTRAASRTSALPRDRTGRSSISIPTPRGHDPGALDRDGTPRPGWPIALSDSCTVLMALAGRLGAGRSATRRGSSQPRTCARLRVRFHGCCPRGRMAGPASVPTLQPIGSNGRRRSGARRGRHRRSRPDCRARRHGPARRLTHARVLLRAGPIANDGVAYASIPTADAPYDSRLTAVGPDRRTRRLARPARRHAPPCLRPPRTIGSSSLSGRTPVTRAGFSRSISSGSAACLVSAGPSDHVGPAVAPGDVDCGPAASLSTDRRPTTARSFVSASSTIVSLPSILSLRSGTAGRSARRTAGSRTATIEILAPRLSCSSLADVQRPGRAASSTCRSGLATMSAGAARRRRLATDRCSPGWPVGLRRPGCGVLVGRRRLDGTVFASPSSQSRTTPARRASSPSPRTAPCCTRRRSSAVGRADVDFGACRRHRRSRPP